MIVVTYDYYHTKELTAISFSKNANSYFNESHLTNEYLDFLYNKIVVEEFYVLNEQMKGNLLDLLNYIRFNRELSKKELEILNEIIVSINSCKISFFEFQCYLAEEFDERKPEGKMEINFLDDNQIDEILSAIEFDFTVLKSLICNEAEYDKLLVSTLSLNKFYFGSINKIGNELPELIDSNMIRIMTVVMVNKKYKKNKRDISNYDHKLFNTVIKEGNKLLKKMKN